MPWSQTEVCTNVMITGFATKINMWGIDNSNWQKVSKCLIWFTGGHQGYSF